MKTSGNTILITGGGTGIGRGLAEAFAANGNTVIVAGRKRSTLDAVVAANAGITAIELDVADPASIAAVVPALLRNFPGLDAVIHNAGMAKVEHVVDAKVADAEATIATNVLGPIRLTAALLPHLLAQPSATIVTVTSGLAFVPLASSPTYSASKAALHSYTESLRHQLAGTQIGVLEIAPPYVQTELGGPEQATDPRAMPLADFIAETMAIITGGATSEVIVEQCRPLRDAEAKGQYAATFAGVNSMFG
ncbi:MAG: SDR family oxidoreductase [Janthinobacterium lividum]